MDLYEFCLGKSAQAWCSPENENTVMDTKLAIEFANILHEQLLILDELRDNLIWCSGSKDFSTEGIAHEGWVKGPRVTLRKVEEYLSS